jgi:hypothetical protein
MAVSGISDRIKAIPAASLSTRRISSSRHVSLSSFSRVIASLKSSVFCRETSGEACLVHPHIPRSAATPSMISLRGGELRRASARLITIGASRSGVSHEPARFAVRAASIGKSRAAKLRATVADFTIVSRPAHRAPCFLGLSSVACAQSARP